MPVVDSMHLMHQHGCGNHVLKDTSVHSLAICDSYSLSTIAENHQRMPGTSQRCNIKLSSCSQSNRLFKIRMLEQQVACMPPPQVQLLVLVPAGSYRSVLLLSSAPAEHDNKP